MLPDLMWFAPVNALLASLPVTWPIYAAIALTGLLAWWVDRS